MWIEDVIELFLDDCPLSLGVYVWMSVIMSHFIYWGKVQVRQRLTRSRKIDLAD
jgi:hypothetical protein